MSQTIKLSRKEINRVRGFIVAAFPNYKGFKVTVSFQEKPVICDDSTGGGTYDRFVLMHVNGARKEMPRTNYYEGARGQYPSWTPVETEVLAVHSWFCGKDSGITLYFHPSLAPKLLAVAS